MLYRDNAAHTLAPNAASGVIRMTSEAGHLVAVSLHEALDPVCTAYHEPSAIYGQIWLTNLETPLEKPLFVLAQGYFGHDISLGWTGSLPLSASDLVMARFTAASNVAASLSFAVER